VHDTGAGRNGRVERDPGVERRAADAGATALRRGQSFCLRARRAATASCRRSRTTSHDVAAFRSFLSRTPVDASHPEILLDFNRCILCEVCVRASAEVDRKDVFALGGRGMTKHLVVNSVSGLLRDSAACAADKARWMSGPVGGDPAQARRFPAVPIGRTSLRTTRPISAVGRAELCATRAGQGRLERRHEPVRKLESRSTGRRSPGASGAAPHVVASSTSPSRLLSVALKRASSCETARRWDRTSSTAGPATIGLSSKAGICNAE
jgi:hypothetical protein